MVHVMEERQEEQEKTIVFEEFATKKKVIIYEFMTFLNYHQY